MRISLIAATLVALPLLAACGSSHSAPAKPAVTAADLSKAFEDNGLKDPKLADCAANIYANSGISQDGLRMMVKPGTAATAANPSTDGLSKADADKARSATQQIVTQCLQ